MIEVFQILVSKYQIDRDIAFRCIHELDKEPLAMSKKLFRRFTLMKLTGMSHQEANDFLGRYYNA